MLLNGSASVAAGRSVPISGKRLVAAATLAALAISIQVMSVGVHDTADKRPASTLPPPPSRLTIAASPTNAPPTSSSSSSSSSSPGRGIIKVKVKRDTIYGSAAASDDYISANATQDTTMVTLISDTNSTLPPPSLAAGDESSSNEELIGGQVLDVGAIQAAQYGLFRHSLSVSVILTIAYTVVFVVGIVGNSFVVAIVCKSPRMRTVTNYFIVNLAFADILVLLFCLPATLASNLFIPYVLGRFVCKTVSYLQGVAVSASINTMVAVTMDRFLAICFPMDWHMSRRTARWTIAGIWLFSLSISLPWALYFTLVPLSHDNKYILNYCTEDWPSERIGIIYFVCANLILLYLFPATVIILCYLGIWYKIERRNIPGDRPKGLCVELIMQKSKLKVVKMMMVVVVIFLLSWLPLYLIFARIKFVEERSPLEDWIITNLMPLAQWLGASNSCINPILYTFFNRKYKSGFIDLLRIGFCCKPAARKCERMAANGLMEAMHPNGRGGGGALASSSLNSKTSGATSGARGGGAARRSGATGCRAATSAAATHIPMGRLKQGGSRRANRGRNPCGLQAAIVDGREDSVAAAVAAADCDQDAGAGTDSSPNHLLGGKRSSLANGNAGRPVARQWLSAGGRFSAKRKRPVSIGGGARKGSGRQIDNYNCNGDDDDDGQQTSAVDGLESSKFMFSNSAVRAPPSSCTSSLCPMASVGRKQTGGGGRERSLTAGNVVSEAARRRLCSYHKPQVQALDDFRRWRAKDTSAAVSSAHKFAGDYDSEDGESGKLSRVNSAGKLPAVAWLDAGGTQNAATTTTAATATSAPGGSSQSDNKKRKWPRRASVDNGRGVGAGAGAGGRSLKSNSTNTTRDTESTDITAISFTNGTTSANQDITECSDGSLEVEADLGAKHPSGRSNNGDGISASSRSGSQRDEAELFIDKDEAIQFDGIDDDEQNVCCYEDDVDELEEIDESETQNEDDDEDEEEDDGNLLFGSTSNSPTRTTAATGRLTKYWKRPHSSLDGQPLEKVLVSTSGSSHVIHKQAPIACPARSGSMIAHRLARLISTPELKTWTINRGFSSTSNRSDTINSDSTNAITNGTTPAYVESSLNLSAGSSSSCYQIQHIKHSNADKRLIGDEKFT